MPILRVTSGPHTGQQFSIQEGSAQIGRESDCAIFLPQDGQISRRHGQLDVQAGRVTAHDLNSSNGLLVNGSRTISTILQPGDQIQAGNTIMVLEADPVSPAPSLPPPAVPAPGSGFPVSHGIPPGPQSMPPPAILPGQPSAPPSPFAGSPGAPSGYPPGYGSFGGEQRRPQPVPFALWLYTLAAFLPPIGVIFGLVYLRKDTPEERRVGKWCIAWAVISVFLTWLTLVAFKAMLPSLLEKLGSSGALNSGGFQGLLGGD